MCKRSTLQRSWTNESCHLLDYELLRAAKGMLMVAVSDTAVVLE
jgi:hypothetical protein